MIRLLDELARLVAYGGFGGVAGYMVGVYVSDRHRLVANVLNEAENDVPDRKRSFSGSVLQTIAVLSVMVALLLTGLVWIQTARENAEQDRRDCLRSIAVSEALQQRTENYLDAARAERRWLIDLRGVLVDFGAKPGSELLVSIDRFRTAQEDYLDHLEENPYPRDNREAC